GHPRFGDVGEGGMVAETPSRGSRRFPEIHINFRTSSRSWQILLPPPAQIAAALAVVAFAVAIYYSALSRYGNDKRAGDKEAAVMRAETANADLQDEVASL